MPTNHARPPSLILGATCAALLATGCKEDEGPGKLFEEDGTWELTQYNLEGEGLQEVDPDNRGEAFLMKFDAQRQVVQTAMCAESETDDPATSVCRLVPQQTQWFCHCFAYAYQEDRMIWRQFTAGESPPMVPFTEGGSTPTPPATGGADTDTDGGGGDETGGVAPGGDVDVMVAPFGMISSTYQFTPFPVGVFGSAGASTFVFEQKAGSKFDQVFDDPDGRATCEPCIPELAE